MIERIAKIKPSERQLLWQQIEFYAFIHFTVNTFTNNEWGNGDEDPKVFSPTELNPEQWVSVCKSAGMKGLILTCKHHDGFCLWPSKYTEHSVKNSLWKNGQGDLVKEVSKACKKGGIKFGVYLSPWDRNEKSYGDSPAYNEYFKNQLIELLSSYGEIFCVWFDGACGEGVNGKTQVYDFEGYYKIIRELQPNAVISVCGPDVRWCGNEAGHCRTSEWSVVPKALLDTEIIKERSQQVDDGTFAQKINATDEDLGSKAVIDGIKELVWFPAEVDTSIRPGWFYHPKEDDKVKSLQELLNIYCDSVGGNAALLLNIPPDTRGLIHENDAARMAELGKVIRETFAINLAEDAKLQASETKDDNHSVNNMLDENSHTCWCPKEGTEKATIFIDLKETKTFDKVMIMEHISTGQRIESFELLYKTDMVWKKLYTGTVVGYKRICCFEKTKARYLKLSITEARWCPTLSKLGVYLTTF